MSTANTMTVFSANRRIALRGRIGVVGRGGGITGGAMIGGGSVAGPPSRGRGSVGKDSAETSSGAKDASGPRRGVVGGVSPGAGGTGRGTGTGIGNANPAAASDGATAGRLTGTVAGVS